MHGSKGSKRRVSTCLACYSRKQKCDRRYPCSHCTHRRRPEECVYGTPAQLAAATPLSSVSEQLPLPSWGESNPLQSIEAADSTSNALSSGLAVGNGYPYTDRSTLIESFGYSEDSDSNTIALLKMWDGGDLRDILMSDKSILPCIMESVQRDLDRMPSRQVLDFLIQYFITELNWIKHLVHAPSFLMRYQQWWLKDRPLAIADVEFAVLILRIALYASQFIQTPSHMMDRISTMTMPELRTACQEVGDSLADACSALDWKGSLVRVQHLLFLAITASCKGRTDQYWEGVGAASQAAQKAGIQRDGPDSGTDGSEWDKEMRRRVLCSLYILDSHLSRQLDRVPFLPDNVVADMLPRMQLVPENGCMNADAGAPETFTERLVQVQLTRFWRGFGPRKNNEYDPILAEEKYEKFHKEFILSLPEALALKADTKWDNHLPKLSLQRQLLYIGIYDSVCWNFRALLLLKPDKIASLPRYKQVLIQSQKKTLAIAALKELEAIASLQSMFNGSFARFGTVIFNTFEASVLLLTLCVQADFLLDQQGDDNGQILGMKVGRLSRKRFVDAASKGFDRLQMLSSVSGMAAAGARTLSHLLNNLSKDDSPVVSTMPPPLTASSVSSTGGTSRSSTYSDMFGDENVGGDNMGGVIPLFTDTMSPDAVLLSDPFAMMMSDGSCSFAGFQQMPMQEFAMPLDFA